MPCPVQCQTGCFLKDYDYQFIWISKHLDFKSCTLVKTLQLTAFTLLVNIYNTGGS